MKQFKISSKIILRLLNIIFGFIRKATLNKKPAQTILVIALHKLGDTIFTVPAIKYLINEFKENLRIVCYPESKLLFEQIFKTKYIVIFHDEIFLNGRIASSKARKKIKSIKPFKIYDLTGQSRSATLIAASGVSHAIGFNQEYFQGFYTEFKLKSTTDHLTNIYLKALGMSYSKKEEESLKEFTFSPANNKKILIHPFAGWKSKEWNLKKYIELYQLLNSDYDCKLVIPPNEISEDIELTFRDLDINFSFTYNIAELIKEVKECSIFIGNDSGPLYIASMFGKPTFTIYSSTNPHFSLPFGSHHSYIQKNIKCSPKENVQYCITNAGRNGCPSFECVNLLSVEEVYEKVIIFLKDIYKNFNPHKF